MVDMAKLTIHRRGHIRKSPPKKKRDSKEGQKVKVAKTRVKPSTFKITDRGKPGRGPKVVPPLEEGALGGSGFFDRSNDEQEQIVFNRAKEAGERKVVGELRALQVFFKTTDPQKSKRALELSKRVAGSFKDRQQVGYPKGFSNKK
jgi:hypothetical protein